MQWCSLRGATGTELEPQIGPSVKKSRFFMRCREGWHGVCGLCNRCPHQLQALLQLAGNNGGEQGMQRICIFSLAKMAVSTTDFTKMAEMFLALCIIINKVKKASHLGSWA